jgi:hypothetical protein
VSDQDQRRLRLAVAERIVEGNGSVSYEKAFDQASRLMSAAGGQEHGRTIPLPDLTHDVDGVADYVAKPFPALGPLFASRRSSR